MESSESTSQSAVMSNSTTKTLGPLDFSARAEPTLEQLLAAHRQELAGQYAGSGWTDLRWSATVGTDLRRNASRRQRRGTHGEWLGATTAARRRRGRTLRQRFGSAPLGWQRRGTHG